MAKEHILNSEKPLSEQQPRKVVFIEMFKAGPQISSTGQKMVFGEEDLDQVVNTYDPTHHEAPLIIGHDQDDGTPALGWVKEVWRQGKELWGKVELTPKAEKLIRDGVFKKVSSSFYLPEAETNPSPGKLALRHLGLVSIPAVKGLSAFSEITGDQTITIAPSEGEFSISFKETSKNTLTMARRKTKTETPASVVEHAEGGMTVNINIGRGEGTSNVYDDSGSKISETGAPADYDMDYGMDLPEDEDLGDPAAPEAEGDAAPEGGDEMGGDTESPEGDQAPSADGDVPPAGDESAPEDQKPNLDTEDVSSDLDGDDAKISEIASKYDIDELIKALAMKAETSSMTEGGDMSYGEMPEALKKAIEEKKGKKEGDEEEKDEESADHSCCDKTDMGEQVSDGEKPKEGETCNAEDVKGGDELKGETVYSEEEEEEEETEGEATKTLDHSEGAMGVKGEEVSLQARVAELEEELARQRKLMREKEISDFCEGIYGEGKLTQQVVPKNDLVRFMETLNAKNSVNFSETGKASQFDFFKNVLEKLPSMVSFEEFATPASAPKAPKPAKPPVDGYVYDERTATLHAQAVEYAESKGVEYTVALKAILSDN